ncbi:MAG: iron ABC transporter [Phototrophicales bacterium]|nr:MAG: iron ABC transporter [Phototrophicales bacterium]RMG75725.1 MAG: iron ABC transporter permease [Chloroflexota bacterium]
MAQLTTDNPKLTSASATFSLPGIRTWGLFSLLILLLLALAASLSLGSVNIPLKDILRILMGQEASRASWERIIWMVRMPGALTAGFAGAALAVSGLQMQTYFSNPLAGPFVIGISSGASLGVALAVLAGGLSLLAAAGLAGTLGLAAAASLGAGFVMILVLFTARRVSNHLSLLLIGVMFGYMTSAFVSILIYFSRPEQIDTYIRWGFGTFGGVTWQTMRVFAPVVILGLIMAYSQAKQLNALILGENYARSMGVNIPRARFMIVVSTALLAGVVTAFCGPVGFIGLAVPHLCRGIFHTADHRILIPAVALMGAVIALAADVIASLPGSINYTLPLNAVTALIGAPVVLWVILRRKS